MRKVVSVMLGVCMVVGIGNIALGQVYLDKSLGNAGRVDKWEPIEVGPQLIGVPGGLGVGARVAYFFPYSNDGVDSKIAYEGLVTYMVNSIFATALSVGYTRPQWNEPVDGKSELTYMNLTFELRGQPEPNFGLYLGFGPSLIFTDFDSSTSDNVKAKDSSGQKCYRDKWVLDPQQRHNHKDNKENQEDKRHHPILPLQISISPLPDMLGDPFHGIVPFGILHHLPVKEDREDNSQHRSNRSQPPDHGNNR